MGSLVPSDGDDRIARIPDIIRLGPIANAMGRDETLYWLSVAEREIVEICRFTVICSLRATIGPDGAAGMVGDGRRAAELMSPTSPFQTAVNLYVGVGLFLTENEGA